MNMPSIKDRTNIEFDEMDDRNRGSWLVSRRLY
jgi:hypothetical protein